MPDAFAALQLFSWIMLGAILVMWIYGYQDEAYDYGKLVLVFLVGAALGVVVV